MTTTQALVLRRFPYGDTSLVVHLVARDRGRLALLVKGAFRPKGAFFGSFDLLDHVSVEVAAREKGGLATPIAVTTLDNHRILRRRLDALSVALYTAELVELGLTEQPSEALFDAFAAWLRWLDAPEPQPRTALALGTLAFEFSFLRHHGLCPVLDACARCGRPDDGSPGLRTVDAAAGGLLCRACAHGLPRRRALSEAARSLARALAEGRIPAASRAALREVRRFLDRFFEHHLEYACRSRPSIEPLWT